MSVIGERPLRADAQRNRAAILKAAKFVLAKQGTDAQMDDIARKAKVGVGTVYRHFPTKDALIHALMVDRFEQIAQFAEEGLEDPDAFNGLVSSFWRGAEMGAKDRAITGLFGDRIGTKGAGPPERLRAAVAELIRRGQAQGTIRPDLSVDDVPHFMCGLTSAMHQIPGDPNGWRRHLQIIIDGLRAGPQTTPLPPSGG